MDDDPIAEVEDTIRHFLRNEIGPAALETKSDAKLAEVGVDSVKVLRVVVNLERHYQIELEDDVIFRAETLRDLAKTIRALVAGRA